MPPSPETALSRSLHDGEAHEVELAALMRAELPRVGRLLVRMLGPRQDLDDLVQTVFLETVRAWPRFRGESAPSTFVAGIAVRVARRAMRPRLLQRLRAELSEDLPASSREPEAVLDDQERMRRVRSALARIKPDKRIAFVLWALEGMEPAQIAQLTGSSLSATRSRIFHAQKELKALAARDPLLCEALGEKS